MAVLTAKVEWRANTANKTTQRFLELLRDFIVTTAGWTLLTDQIGSGAENAYFVVTKDRQTGFTGDNPIVRIQYLDGIGKGWNNAGSFIKFTCYSAWSGTTGTNPTTMLSPWDDFSSSAADGGGKYYMSSAQALNFSTVFDTDFYISVDTTGKFILATSKVIDWGNTSSGASSNGVLYGPIQGIACFERLAGDTSTGTYFGHVDTCRTLFKHTVGRFPVPLRWDNVNSSNSDCYFNVGTRLGIGYNTLTNVNESGKHVMLDLELRRQDYNRIRGKIYGLALTTQTQLFPHHTIFPSVSAPEWLICKVGHVGYTGVTENNQIAGSPYNMGMQIGSTITTLS